MCAPELNFLDYGLPHFQTCPLLSRLRGRARVGVKYFFFLSVPLWLTRILPSKCELNKKPPSSACLDGGSLTLFVAQRSYPDLGFGFLLCFICLLTNVFIIFSRIALHRCDKSSTKNPPVRAGSFALLMLSKPKIPDLDRAALLGFLGERYSKHDNSFAHNGG